MNWNVNFKTVVFGVLLSIFCSCQSEYDKAVKKELSTGVVYTDLVLGLEMGQTKQEFYTDCWELNRDKKVSQGPSNNFVKYIVPPGEIKGEDDEIEMLFYGIFDDDEVMRGLDSRFCYLSWSPWNQEYYSDQLIETLKGHYIDMYQGNQFIEIDLKDLEKKAFVKVDGNRQILIYSIDTKDVVVKIEDLRYKYNK